MSASENSRNLLFYANRAVIFSLNNLLILEKIEKKCLKTSVDGALGVLSILVISEFSLAPADENPSFIDAIGLNS